MTNEEIKENTPHSGYTLPVFACAAAVAALKCLRGEQQIDTVTIDLIQPPQTVNIPIQQVAPLNSRMALAVTRSDPGANLDLTRDTPIWALVETLQPTSLHPHQITIKGGEGIGRIVTAEGKAAIYSYAEKLLRANLAPYLKSEEKIEVTIILPEGRRLAQRTSNAAFGVLEGLSLLGTTGISQPLSAPEQLELYREELQQKAENSEILVFCLGENGLNLAQRLGIDAKYLVKTANWIGAMLVAAGISQVKSLLLFGYHGKLIKLAGGIFHTHHHLADGRLEILTAYCAECGLPTSILQQIFACPTTEAALQLLREIDTDSASTWVEQVYGKLATEIATRSQDYIQKHCESEVEVGAILFGRERKIIAQSSKVTTLLAKLC
ncbi:cobalt-precorrin-5B (C(1))-methyltransferase CbiD [Oscillatoria salina]|uniref:cobalt-precorrin-5B (C(1))-methyltransferase CbiD n=1 Tax=Oscillatoria salina TaxID=331517 RepID=UPI001CCC6B32|nr:cobalt-precorrin-5B (C(1))-methyltransferase CbiD [Oscillatoria salina]MBZ8182108.1 cobalt-precorrin-5B (C(1))-methyltransferase [Oscillatoria salina IIICB1]